MFSFQLIFVNKFIYSFSVTKLIFGLLYAVGIWCRSKGMITLYENVRIGYTIRQGSSMCCCWGPSRMHAKLKQCSLCDRLCVPAFGCVHIVVFVRTSVLVCIPIFMALNKWKYLWLVKQISFVTTCGTQSTRAERRVRRTHTLPGFWASRNGKLRLW